MGLNFSFAVKEAKPSEEIVVPATFYQSVIISPTVSMRDSKVCNFRNTFQLKKVPESLVINLTAENRYILYVNGKYITSEASPLLDYADLTHLRVFIGNHSVTAGESICLDNFTVATFGSGNGAYSGDISELFGDTSINLTECADSVLYKK